MEATPLKESVMNVAKHIELLEEYEAWVGPREEIQRLMKEHGEKEALKIINARIKENLGKK